MKSSVSLGFRSERALVAWIDILGASKLSDDELQGFSSVLCQTTSFMSGVGASLPLADENTVNAILIGDAVCITQNFESQSNRNFVATAALNFSETLFKLGFPHRGVLVEGSVRCSPAGQEGGRYITGGGVIKAFEAEKALKLAGLMISEELLLEARNWHPPWGEIPFQIVSKESRQHFLTSPEHLKLWSDFTEQRAHEHPYLQETKVLLDAHKTDNGQSS